MQEQGTYDADKLIVRLKANRCESKIQRPAGRETGFTLVEVLCAITLFAIAAAALFSAFSNGYAILRVTRDDDRATQILTQKTEAIRLFTWANLSNCPTSFVDYFYPAGLTNGKAGTTYYGTIAPFGDPTNIPSSVSYRTNIHLVTITLVWANSVNRNTVNHTRQVQTMLAADGMQNYTYFGYSP